MPKSWLVFVERSAASNAGTESSAGQRCVEKSRRLEIETVWRLTL